MLRDQPAGIASPALDAAVAEHAARRRQLADCATGCEWTAEREAIDRDGSRANRIAAISWIAGGLAVAGGLTLYVVGRTKKGTSERTSLLFIPTVAPTAAAVSARFRF